jgi:hypothetical protein
VMTLFVVLLPARRMVTTWAAKLPDEGRYRLGLAEARALDDVRDGELVSELSHRLRDAGFHDWAVEAAARGSGASQGSPSHWRALLATSTAYVDRLDAVPALAYARRALSACEAARALDDRVCPSEEEVRMELYAKHLDAGVASGIDPHKNPHGFRAAGEAALRTIRIQGDPKLAAPPPAPTLAPAGATPPGPVAPAAAPTTAAPAGPAPVGGPAPGVTPAPSPR